MAERPLLGEVLVQAGLIDELQLARALGEQKRWGGRLGLALLRLGFVTEDGLLRTLSNQLGVPAVRLGTKRVASEVLDLLPAELAEKYRCIPLFVKREAGRELLHLGMEDPTDLAAIDDVSFRTGRRVRPVLMGPDELRRCLARFYREGDPGEDDLPVSEEQPPEQAAAPERAAPVEAPLPPDDPTIVAATAVVSGPSESLYPQPEADPEPGPDPEADLDIVAEETLAQGMDSAAEESGATTSFAGPPVVSSPDWTDDEQAVAEPPESPELESPSPVAADSAWTDAEPMSETDLPSASASSALLEELDPGDSLDIDMDDELAEAAPPESEALEPAPEPEDLSSRHLSHPQSQPMLPIPPEDPQDSAMLLPLEDEAEQQQPDADTAFDAAEETQLDQGWLGVADLEPPPGEPIQAEPTEAESLGASASEPFATLPEDVATEPDEVSLDAEAAFEPEDADATLAPQVEPLALAVAHDESPAISTRDVLRALTELLVEKGILEPSELLERVRASRAANDPS